ncbi:hypothetical protein BJ742DRAFT_147279 [Cladochytrium replicatum]|nr:hypothetical protein BJ742DRAFT_147279 [Cladochytrium replicatum]
MSMSMESTATTIMTTIITTITMVTITTTTMIMTHDHDHGNEEQRRDQQRVMDAMKLVAKDPEKSVEALKRGNPLFINAIAQLCTLSAPLPEELRSEKIPSTLAESSSSESNSEQGSGYSPYFVEHGAIEALLSHATSEGSSVLESPRNSGEQALHIARISVILGALITFLGYDGADGDKIRERFVNSGGIEVVRGAPFKAAADETTNGSYSTKFPGLFKLREDQVARGCLALVETLQEDGKYLRACDFCGKRELKMDEWKQCAKCRFSSYCSKECQVNDWKEGSHRTLCVPVLGR